MEYEAVIGLEVHVQLQTRSKMFTRAPYGYGYEPNTLTNPVIMGLPGTLPVMNKEAIHRTILLGLLCRCKIAEVCKWDRKNYFYPDNPKNYQISQYDQPICIGGEVEIELPGPSRNVMGEHRTVKLTRIHLEEDVGKLTHFGNDSLVDYNRAGSALVEIVTEPDMHSADEVFAFLTALRNNIVYAGLSDCDMEKGQLRCDANISVRPKGETKLGTKVELKNMNSISGVRNAVAYEIQRQIFAIQSGTERIVQETRRWDPDQGITTSMRTKEEAHDYRYFPDPDLMPVVIGRDLLEEYRKELPELPFDRQRRYQTEYDLPYTLTSVICPSRPLAEFFEEALKHYHAPKPIANIIVNELLRELAASGEEGEGALPLHECKVSPKMVADLARLVEEGVITRQIAKDVFQKMYQSGESPEIIVEREGLKNDTDSGAVEALCREVIADPKFAKAIKEYREGNEKALNSLKGPIMKATQGKADPKVLDQILRKLLA